MKNFSHYLSHIALLLGLALWSTEAKAAEITAIDFNGNPLGQVISTGMVINADGDNIGYMTADSLIMDNDDRIIGGVVPQGVAIGLDNRLLGKVHSDGVVRSLSGKDLGRALPNGLVINNNSEIIGTILYPGLVYSAQGQTVGRLTGAGTYTNLDGQEIGFVSANGYAYRRSGDSFIPDGRLISSKMVVALDGHFIGSLAPSGKVVDFEGKEIGNIHANGYVYNSSGAIIGGLVNSGYAFDMTGNYMGIVSYNGTIVKDEQAIGYYRPDGNIVNDKDTVIGYFVPMTATATDLRGRYLGRLIVGGDVVNGGNKVGKVKADGYVYDDKNIVIGELVKTGPVFDTLAHIKGQAMPNGTLISLGGGVIGRIKGEMAFDTNGTLIGATVVKKLAIDNNNKSLGSAGFDATVQNGSEVQRVSPFGYLLNSDNKVVGSAVDMSAVYGLEGKLQAYVLPNGGLYPQQENGILTVNGTLVNREGWLGEIVNPLFVLGWHGQQLGLRMQGNLLQNAKGQVSYKITPANYVLESDAKISADLSPVNGFGSSRMIALNINGDLMGYANVLGEVQDLNSNVIGTVVFRDYVADSNGVVSGRLIDFATVNNDKCDVIGAVNGRGDIINNRDVLIGRLLPNGQAISDVGSYLGYSVSGKGLIDFNGKYVGTVNAGHGIGLQGQVLGCVNRYGQIIDTESKIRYGVITPEPVINFENNVVGHVLANGQIADANSKIIGYMQPNGNAISTSGRNLGQVFKYAVAYDNSNNFLGMVQNTGQVLNSSGDVVGTVNFDGSVVNDGENIGYALYDFYVYDENFVIYGYVAKDGSVLSMVGSRIGKIDKGFVVDKNGRVVARGNRDYIVRNNEKETIGNLRMDGTVVDFNGKNIGKLSDSGVIRNDNNEEIAYATSLQYYVAAKKSSRGTGWADTERVRLSSSPKPKAPASIVGEGGDAKSGFGRRIIGIALSPDGDILGKIYDDDSVKNDEGLQIGYRTPDGIVVDMNYNPIGIEEVKRSAPAGGMFVPADAFGNGNAYGIGTQPSNLGPGGGYGQGERYDPVRQQALAQLQARRRGDISVGKISSGISPSSFTGYEEDGWPGVNRNISSWRVDMSQMILEDKPIPAVLARSVYASEGFSDNIPITAVVERNVYAEEGRNIIIPAGSRVIGRLGGGSTGGNSGGAVKIGISWRRLIRPDGSQFIFSNANTADAQGRAGAIGYLDEQLLKRYTLPLLTTALESGVAYVMASGKGTTNYNNGDSTQDARSQAAEEARQNFISQMNTIFEDILQRKANIRSVTYVPAGTRIIIFPNEDLWLNDAKRAMEKEEAAAASGKKTVPAPLIDDNKPRGGNVTYDGNYNENVQPVSAARRAQPQQQKQQSRLIDDNNSSNRQPVQSTPITSSSDEDNSSDDIPDLL